MPRRILFVNTPTYIGGAEISLLTLMKHLSADRYAPYLLTSGDGPLLRQAHEMGIPVAVQEFPWFSKRKPWEYAFSIYRLVRMIQINKIELVHTNCDHSLRYVMQACKLTRVPYVSHVRDFVRTWFQPEKVSAMNRSDYVIANSNAIAKACNQAGIEPQRIKTIYNPVAIEEFLNVSPVKGLELRAELNLAKDALVIGIVGQIQSIKGHREFVEAGIRLVEKVPNVHFMIVGSVPSGDSNDSFITNLNTRIVNSGYANHFHFLGFRSDIPTVMKSIDILVVPSYREPFGRVVVEGLAAGCAVVGTNVGGLPEIITDEVDGLLVPPGDAHALLATITRLAVTPKLRQQLVQTGCCTAQRFTIANHVEQVQTLYDKVISAH